MSSTDWPLNDELIMIRDTARRFMRNDVRPAEDKLPHTRISYSAGVIGVAQEALAMAIDWVKQRKTFGALGVAQEMPLERWYREMRIKRLGEGPSEVQRLVVARDILGTKRNANANAG